MTPEERQLLSGLFDRIHAGANQPRDREAETFIADGVRSQPYAPYLLAQTVIVQEQALKAAAERLEQLEAQVKQGAAQPEGGSFLGSIGKSIFGSGQESQPRSAPGAGQGGPWGQAPQAQQGWSPPAQQGWSQAPQQGGFAGAAPAQGGGFLKGALGAAAGVAGGVLLADSLRGLFGGHNNPFGIASGGFGGGMGGFGTPGGETVVNNYYGDGQQTGGDSFDPMPAGGGTDGFLDSSDNGNGDFDPGTGGDDSYNV